jgi:hypothetical protein
LDGEIVRARRGKSRKNGDRSGNLLGNLFEVMTGKSILSFRRDDPDGAPAPASSKCFALVRSVDKKPKRRLFTAFMLIWGGLATSCQCEGL